MLARTTRMTLRRVLHNDGEGRLLEERFADAARGGRGRAPAEGEQDRVGGARRRAAPGPARRAGAAGRLVTLGMDANSGDQGDHGYDACCPPPRPTPWPPRGGDDVWRAA